MAAMGKTRMSAIGSWTGDNRMSHQAAQQLSPQAHPERWLDAGLMNCKWRIANGKSSKLAAFTLIELMVVMVLIGVMTAMILPEMKGTYEDALLRSTSRELVSVCSLASSHAVSGNQAYRLRLDLKTGRYLIERRTSDRGPEGRLVATREVPGGEGELDTRISIEIHKTGDDVPEGAEQGSSPASGGSAQLAGRDDGITFYPDGTADASEILLRDRDGFRMALRINPVTARVRIIELARE
jgi:prepilin-type N-terminal cleavage/methylation domain-containing protein